MDQQHTKLRVCGSCEWIFKEYLVCPKCGFAYYGAKSVYGDKCYKYAKTQQPWIDKKIARCVAELKGEVNASKEKKRREL